VIDADSHAAEDVDALGKAFDDERRALAPRRAGLPGLESLLSLAGRMLTARFSPPVGAGPLPASVFDPRARVAWLEAEGIDAAVVFPTIGLLAPVYEDAWAAAAFCRAVNDWVIAFCDAVPHRLAPVAVLPQQQPELAGQELTRACSLGAVAGVIRPNEVAGHTPADACFESLWSLAVDLDVALVLHEGTFDVGITTLGADRAASYAELHLMAHPFEVQATLGALALRGRLARFPGLRLGCFEAGFGWAPYLAHRVASHAAAYLGAPSADDLPGEHVWVTAEPEEPLLQYASALGWGSRVCFATDFPHADCVQPGAVRHIRHGLGLDETAAGQFLGSNALEFFGDRLAARLRLGSLGKRL
jgi:predicted TIM-barrel fold metal-dependent hydrolase